MEEDEGGQPTRPMGELDIHSYKKGSSSMHSYISGSIHSYKKGSGCINSYKKVVAAVLIAITSIRGGIKLVEKGRVE